MPGWCSVGNLLDDAFSGAYDDMELELRELLRRRLLDMAWNGVTGAARGVESEFGLSIDWEITSAEAERWARKYSAELAKQISKNTRVRVGEQVASYIASPGADLQSLIDSIVQRNISEYRASVIAVTETTRAYARGSQIAWQGAGVNKMQWKANHDELQCPYCSAVDQRIVEIGEPFGENADGEAVTEPPMHVNCRCWLSPVAE